MSDKVEISKVEYDEFLKWKNSQQDNSEKSEELIQFTYIKDDYSDDLIKPNDYSDDFCCKLMSMYRNCSSFGITDEETKRLYERNDNLNDLFKDIESEYGKCYFKLVDFYDHSVVSVHFTEVNNPSKRDKWDSSIAGVCFLPEKELKSIYGDVTEDLINEQFENYEKACNSYLSGSDCYISYNLEVKKKDLVDAIAKNKIDEFAEYSLNMDCEVDSIGSCYELYNNLKEKIMYLNEYFYNDLIVYNGKIYSKDEQQTVEDVLGGVEG